MKNHYLKKHIVQYCLCTSRAVVSTGGASVAAAVASKAKPAAPEYITHFSIQLRVNCNQNLKHAKNAKSIMRLVTF